MNTVSSLSNTAVAAASPSSEGLTPEQREAHRSLFIPAILIGVFSFIVLLTGGVKSAYSVDWFITGNVMLNSGSIGQMLCFLTVPRHLRAWWIIAAMVIGEMYMWYSRPLWWDWGMRLQGFGFVGGLVANAGLAYAWWRARGDDRLWVRSMLLLCLIMFAFPSVSSFLHRVVIQLTPYIFDAAGWMVDGTFGFQPSAAASAFVRTHPLMQRLIFFTYNELPLFLMAAAVLGLRYPRRCYPNLMLHFIVIGLVGMVCYVMLPMIGADLYIGRENFPFGPLPAAVSAEAIYNTSHSTRNCYPSLHLGWMLAIFFGVRRVSPYVKYFLGTLVGLMVFATLDVGHYAIDLVGSFPYVVLFFALLTPATAANRVVRLQGMVGCALMFALFTLLLRFAPTFVAQPAVLLPLVLIIVGGSVFLERRLADACMDPCG